MGTGSIGGFGTPYVNPKVAKTPLKTLLAKQQEDYNNSSANPVKVKKFSGYDLDLNNEDDGGDFA